MKIENGKLYRTKNKKCVRIVDIRESGYGSVFLGVIEGSLPQTFWYNNSGRLYSSGISPFDIEKEILTKLEFITTFLTSNGKLSLELPVSEIEDLLGKQVKITVEYLDEKNK